MNRVLKKGLKGADVERWQTFLIGEGFNIVADGDFGPATEKATKGFQKGNHTVKSDGIVGNQTLAFAMREGFSLLEIDTPTWTDSPGASLLYPPKPDFKPVVGNAARGRRWGRFDYESAPTKRNRERIIIDPEWVGDNIVRVQIPQLVAIPRGKPGGRHIRTARCHVKIKDQLLALWQAWEDDCLLDLVLTYNGDFVPRFIRGSTKTLSNHAWGTAFDINVQYNPLGHTPQYRGQLGSVRELVPLANKYGFYWGGHYSKRADGMHFEAARVV